ncbi:type VI secretion system tip protein VgrG [Chania multitudinisentens]|uniref:type VI secretion system Vgr family protein n=1 Tax=Chania multitudinisentens TaxID=1639108 RepID=UPI0009DF728C|nr:type VI secretion system tip protein VgrG [Chania multitudinisentens]
MGTQAKALGGVQPLNLAAGGGASSLASSAANALLGGAQPSGLQFTLTAVGLPPQTFVVVDFSLSEMYSSPFVLNVGLASADPAVDFAAVLDQDATLFIWREGVLQRSVTGMVASFEQGDTGFHQTRYSMVIRPALWRTSLRRNSRIFQQENIESIITTLLKENGINEFAFAFRNPHPAREFCVQYNETDFDFIQRLTAEEGIFYYFEFSTGKNTIVYADDVGSLPKGAPLPYNPNVAAQAQELCITTFTRSAQVRPAMVQLKDYTFKNPYWAAAFSKQSGELQNQRPDYEHFDFPGRFKDEQHGQDFTRYRLEGLRNDANLGQGQSNDFTLQPGQLFSLYNHPRGDLNHPWQLLAIQHSGSQPQALEQESGEQGTYLSNQFSFIPHTQTWRPTPLPKPAMDGPQIAMVVGPASEEIYCDEFGRIRLQFLWDRYGQSDDNSSCWIRVTQPWAGQGWGMIAIPRIGQEVVVDFLHGDPDQPIVTGRTYHANNLPSIGLPAAKTQMAFRSKTHKGEGYNELRFEDSKGAEGLFLHAQKDMNTVVLNDRTTAVLANHAESVTLNQTVQIGENQSVQILANQGIQVKEMQNTLVGGDKITNVGGGILMASAKGLRLVCGDAVLEMNAETGNISLICNNFNIYAKDLGQITAGSLLDLNMDDAKPGTTAGPSVGDINSAVASAFSGNGGK